ncbi:hypothetical protein HN588_10110 [Candidatus Bathyarchaeota archaeon]|jgi:hypothetical protein|nr:hypothetical protein [Candidatus Bathyarchaeota archaeon]
MEFFDAILTTEVLAGILIIGAFAMGIRSTLHFSKGAADLRPKLNEVERALKKLRDGMGDRKKAVVELTQAVAPVKDIEARMRLYYEQGQEMNIEHEKKEQKDSEQEESSRKRRIQRKKMGYEGDD